MYIHYYTTENDFNSTYYGEEYEEPWVSYVNEALVERTDYNKTDKQVELSSYLTFEVTGAGNIKFKDVGDGQFSKTIFYSLNDGDWTEVTSDGNLSIGVEPGDVVRFKGNNASYSTGDDVYCTFSGTTCGFNLRGNIMSLVDGDGLFAVDDELTEGYAFNGLFKYCTGLTGADRLQLPAMALTEKCYFQMFYGCSHLVSLPELPATELAAGCYRNMFNRCFSLDTVDLDLPATTLPEEAYRGMFAYCSGITEVNGTIPATDFGRMSCYSMFVDCCGMTRTVESVGGENCVIGENACNSMFLRCISLEKAPVIPATSVGVCGCTYMFGTCRSLTDTPDLSGILDLDDYAYWCMFYRCSVLTGATELPATNLAKGCYRTMFNRCTPLSKAPMLPAENLADECYMFMFNHTQVNSLVCLATTLSATTDSVRSCLYDLPTSPRGKLYINPMSTEAEYEALKVEWENSTHDPEPEYDEGYPIHDLPASWDVVKYQG